MYPTDPGKNGTVTGVKSGVVRIFASADGITRECTVTVKAPEITLKPISVMVGQTLALVKGTHYTISPDIYDTPEKLAMVFNAAGWTLDPADNSVAKVLAPGTVTGVAEGTAKLTVRFGSGPGSTCDVTVTVEVFDDVVPQPTGTGTVTITAWVDNKDTLVTDVEAVTLRRGLGETALVTGITTAGYSDWQWSVNGKDVPGATTSTYTFDSAGKGNGKYTVGLQVKKDNAWYASSITTITVTN
jgi:hypothetical protein